MTYCLLPMVIKPSQIKGGERGGYGGDGREGCVHRDRQKKMKMAELLP